MKTLWELLQPALAKGWEVRFKKETRLYVLTLVCEIKGRVFGQTFRFTNRPDDYLIMEVERSLMAFQTAIDRETEKLETSHAS